MSADLSSVAREAAHELERQLPGGSYADGWADCASRLPSEEELATELEKHKLIHASVSRKAAFCRCDSSVKAGTDENLAWFETHRARAVLALIGERLTQ